jgi:hypothetical protein
MIGRRAHLTAALGFARLEVDAPELRPLRRWLDSWAGLGAVVEGMAQLGFDVALTRHGDGGTPWRALFYPGGFVHVSKAGSAWGARPWGAVHGAAWEGLGRPPHAKGTMNANA